jgi:ABC-type transporter Mla MlaB component
VMRLRHAQVYSWIENDVNLRLIGDLSRSEMIRIIESISSN